MIYRIWGINRLEWTMNRLVGWDNFKERNQEMTLFSIHHDKSIKAYLLNNDKNFHEKQNNKLKIKQVLYSQIYYN